MYGYCIECGNRGGMYRIRPGMDTCVVCLERLKAEHKSADISKRVWCERTIRMAETLTPEDRHVIIETFGKIYMNDNSISWKMKEQTHEEWAKEFRSMVMRDSTRRDRNKLDRFIHAYVGELRNRPEVV